MRLANSISLYELVANRKLHKRYKFQGLLISIENRKGSIRRGKTWKTKMTYDYGYIRKSMGVDGDHVDCFIGPNANATTAFVIHTQNPRTKKYDEDKVMLGFDSAEEAKSAFLENYDKKEFFQSMDSIPMDAFKRKVLDTKEQPAKIAARTLPGMLKIETGGPGSGRRPEFGSNGKPRTPKEKKALERARKDARQQSMFGPEHEKELQKKGTKVSKAGHSKHGPHGPHGPHGGRMLG